MSELSKGKVLSAVEQIQLRAEKAAAIAGVLRQASLSPEAMKMGDITYTAEVLEDITEQVSTQLKAILKCL